MVLKVQEGAKNNVSSFSLESSSQFDLQGLWDHSIRADLVKPSRAEDLGLLVSS